MVKPWETSITLPPGLPSATNRPHLADLLGARLFAAVEVAERRLPDRRQGKWDRFSVYLTIGESHPRNLNPSSAGSCAQRETPTSVFFEGGESEATARIRHRVAFMVAGRRNQWTIRG